MSIYNFALNSILLCDSQAASLRVAEQYIQAFGNIAKEVKELNYPLSLASISMQLVYWNSMIICSSTFLSFSLFYQGNTLLLPSSASSPANMIAQALTMYKSLVSNASREGSLESSSPGILEGKGDAPTGEPGDDNSPSAETIDVGSTGKPGFSLQNPRKRE